MMLIIIWLSSRLYYSGLNLFDFESKIENPLIYALQISPITFGFLIRYSIADLHSKWYSFDMLKFEFMI